MRTMRWILGLSCVGSLLVGGLARGEDVVDRFKQHVQTLPNVAENLRTETLDVVSAVASDPYARDLAIGDGLATLYPEFSTALDELGQEKIADAKVRLERLAADSDPYLAAAALFLQARAELMEERFDRAIPLLQQVASERAEHSSQVADAMYFLGMSQAAMLDNTKAIETLTGFLESYPNAPERMRVGAWRRLQELHSIQEGSMSDVYQRMEFSRRQLQVQDTGDRTQEEQAKIVAMLDQLIEKAEESECQGGNCNKPGESQAQGQGQKPSEGQGQGQSGNGSRNPNGVARRSFDDGPASEWSRLRDRSRDPAFNAIKEKYPPRYQQLIEQYYRSFQEEGSAEASVEAPADPTAPGETGE